MLTRRFQDSSTQPDYFLSPALDEANDNGHLLISGESKRKRPYAVQWQSETYVDGQLVARQLDTEQATENPLASRDPFAPGKGLTEDDNPLVLLRSSHELELFKDGSSSLSMHSEMHEVVNIYDRDVAMVDTHVTVDSGVKLPSNDSRTLWRGRLDTLDEDAHAASQGISKNLGQYLAAVHGMISEQQTQGDQANALWPSE